MDVTSNYFITRIFFSCIEIENICQDSLYDKIDSTNDNNKDAKGIENDNDRKDSLRNTNDTKKNKFAWFFNSR